MVDVWHSQLLRPRDVVRRLRARTTAGTTATSGFTQRVSPPAHAWVIEYHGIMISTADELAAWDAAEASLDGGANDIYVPLVGDDDGPVPAIFVGDHFAGQTVILLRREGDIIRNGRHFGAGGSRLHRIWWIQNQFVNDYQVHIRPALRENYPSGSAVNWVQPLCKCRLATDDEMALTITPGRIAIGDVKFIENAN